MKTLYRKIIVEIQKEVICCFIISNKNVVLKFLKKKSVIIESFTSEFIILILSSIS